MTITGATSTRKDAIWTVRRIIADFTETQFYANELASIGVIIGVVIAFLANPLFPLRTELHCYRTFCSLRH